MSEPKEALKSFFDFNVEQTKKAKEKCTKASKEIEETTKTITLSADKIDELLKKFDKSPQEVEDGNSNVR